ncbi:MAG TPA: hypothetical protein VJS30_27320 [Paraburkholderia sp.]|nr:hypothetical protein [Paraburkholderia sp.]
MTSIATILLVSAMSLSSATQAQSLPRDDGHQQLAQAPSAGVDPHLAHRDQAQTLASADSDAPVQARESSTPHPGFPTPNGNQPCIGPISFCNVYAGS